MINYSLICNKDHKFEAWFRSYDEYNKQIKLGLLNCPVCGEKKVSKALMAPAVQSSKNKEKERKSNKVDLENLNKDKEIASIAPNSEQVRIALKMIKSYVEKNCENVGDNFAQEARSIHYDNKTSKGIYGKASSAETSELLEEGIDVITLPWAKKTEN